MGPTIHYSLRSEAASPKEARRLVESLRRHAVDLLGPNPDCVDEDLMEVREVQCDSGPELGRRLRRAARAGHDAREPLPPRPVADHVFFFVTYPNEVTGAPAFGLCRYAESAPERGVPSLYLPGWTWDVRTDTGLAEGGRPILREHLAVVGLLDHAADLGILGEVVDETGFFEHRNVEALAEAAGLAPFDGPLECLLEPGFVEAIMSRPTEKSRTEVEGGSDPAGERSRGPETRST